MNWTNKFDIHEQTGQSINLTVDRFELIYFEFFNFESPIIAHLNLPDHIAGSFSLYAQFWKV